MIWAEHVARMEYKKSLETISWKPSRE